MDRGKPGVVFILMKGIIVAAGKGERLGGVCKALIKIDNKYLIEFPLGNMKDLGIKEVIIVQHGGAISEKLGNTYQDMKLIYVQQEERKGIGHAVSLTKDVIGDDSFCIILGDIIYKGTLQIMKTTFETSNLDCMVGLKQIQDREEIKKSYGHLNGKFIEKPKDVSNFPHFLGLGIYMANPNFYKAIEKVRPVNDEIGITDALNKVKRIRPFLLNEFYQNINTKEELESFHGL